MMKSNKKIIRNLVIICILILIIEFLITYKSLGATSSIGVALVENGNIIAIRSYESNLGDGVWSTGLFSIDSNKIEFGKNYEEKLCVKNAGNIDIYARVIISRKLYDPDGKKSIDPSAFYLEVNDENWIISENESNIERTVMYYKKIISEGESTTNFLNNINIESDITDKYHVEEKTTDEGKIITMKNKYDNCGFHLEVTVNAVQTHNGVDAMKSAWGIDVTLDDEGNILSIE